MYKFNFGKHKNKYVSEVLKNDSSYLLYVLNNFKYIDKDLLEFIKKNEKKIRKNAATEEYEFLRERCDGEVCVEY